MCITEVPESQGTTTPEPIRDLPFLVGFGHEATALLALAGIVHDGTPTHDALGAVLVNAVLGIREKRWTSYSRFEGFYRNLTTYSDLLRCRLIIRAVEDAEARGLIVHEKGRSWRDGGKGWQSRFRASDRFSDMLDGHALLNRGTIIRATLRNVLQLYHPETGALMAYGETAKTRTMRGEILDWNADLARHRIGISDPRVKRIDGGLLEVPTGDGNDTFLVRDSLSYCRQFRASWDRSGRVLWDLHGRCYGPAIQSLPKAVRETVTIDNGPSGRLDYGNSHLRLAYAAIGVDPGLEDAYRVSGYESDTGRKLMKRATNIALNAATKDKAIRRVALDLACADRKAETGSESGAIVGPEDMGKALRAIEAVETRHPALHRTFYTGAGLRFMATEADIMLGVVKAARRFNIPVMSIHDEALFPADRGDRIESLMHDTWRKTAQIPALVRQ